MPEEIILATEQSVLSVIERVAMNPELSPDKLHSLLDFQERIMNKNAEIAFNRDFALASEKMPQIKKRGVIDMGAKGKMTFAKYEDLDKELKPIEKEFGFTRSFLTNPTPNGIEMTIRLTHKEGHSITSSRFMPADSGAGRNAMQAIGSASSYAKRYLTLDLWNIVTIGQDDDGYNSGVISDSQVAQIEVLLDEIAEKKIPINMSAFLKIFDAKDIYSIQQRDFEDAISKLKQKIREKK